MPASRRPSPVQSHTVPVEMLTIVPGLTLAKGVVNNATAAGALSEAEVERNDLLPGGRRSQKGVCRCKLTRIMRRASFRGTAAALVLPGP